MKVAKKFMALLLAGALAFTGCSAGSGKASSEAGSAESGATSQADGSEVQGKETGKELNIIYLTPSTASQFWTHIGIGIENAMKDMEAERGVKVNYSVVGPAEESQTEQYVTAFEQAISKKPDAIITATLAIDATVPKAQEATKNGIILNFVNCGLGVGDDGKHEDAYNQFYFCSNDTIGEMAGQAFMDAMKAKGITEGTIGVNTNVENEALNHRVDGFRAFMAKNAPKMTLTETYYNGNVVEKAQANAENIISTFGDKLVGMYSGNNITGDGVVLAVAGAGIGSKIVNVAVDSDDAEIKALQEGNLDALIVQDAYDQGYRGMKNAIETLLDGKNPEEKKQVNCPPSIVTKANMNDEKMKALLDPTILKK